MMEKQFTPEKTIDDLILHAQRQSDLWTFRAASLRAMKADYKNLQFKSQNEMFTFIYRLYQALTNIKQVADVAYDCGLVVKTGAMKNHPWRKLLPDDITAIIDYQDIEDKQLQEEVRAYYNHKRPDSKIDDNWNLSGNYERFKTEADAKGYMLIGSGPKHLPLIQITVDTDN